LRLGNMEPFVLRGYIDEWPAMKWTPETLCDYVRPTSTTKHLKLRFGSRKHIRGNVLFENESKYLSIKKLDDMLKWFIDDVPFCKDDDNADSQIQRDTHWAYFDYKYVFEVMNPERINDIDWKVFGVNVNPVDSTIWIGTPGAYTPCHFDSYGFNLHAQLHGAKRWILMEPQEEMKPTRIPYEESTVFSRVDVIGGDPYLKDVPLRTVTLNRGDVLFVPPGWWHSVQCVTPGGCDLVSKDAVSVSVNTWIPVPIFDRIGRAREAAASAIVSLLAECQLIKTADLCPSESALCLGDSMDVLGAVIDDLKTDCDEEDDETTSENAVGNTTLSGEPPSSKRLKCDQADNSCEVKISSTEKDAGQLHVFLKRYEDSGITVPSISYENLLKELRSGPLELDDSELNDQKQNETASSRKYLETRRFLDALTCPETMQTIVDHMLNWES
uniref:JmjC domain-containing protein n=1 Tax=Anisakis simplex TaxID=6269 RepID=A0A0M3K3D8_ANISI